MFESNATELAEATFGTAREAAEISVVDAVLWACDLSEDEIEVGDLVDAALGHAEVHVLRSPGLEDTPSEPRELRL